MRVTRDLFARAFLYTLLLSLALYVGFGCHELFTTANDRALTHAFDFIVMCGPATVRQQRSLSKQALSRTSLRYPDRAPGMSSKNKVSAIEVV